MERRFTTTTAIRTKTTMRIITSLLIVHCLLVPAIAAFAQQLSSRITSRKLLQQSLADCLAPSGARLVFPGDSDYVSARGHVFNHRYLYSPAAFVFSSTTAHVQSAVSCAVRLNFGIAPRSGGHSYEDYSLGGRDGVIVVDLEGMNDVSYDARTKIASIGGGARLGPIKLALWEQGKVAIPSGTCPSVGVGGHCLGGGRGFISRKWGLMADSLVSAELVTANGTLVTASSAQNSDLLFALRGAGANSFGIVTRFFCKTYDVSKNVTYFMYNYVKAEQAQTTKAYQIWGVGASNDVSASLYHDPAGGNIMWGIYLGPKSNLRNVLKAFLDNAPATPSSTTEIETDYITTAVINAGFQQSDPISILNLRNFVYESWTFKSKAIFVKGSGWSDDAIQAYITALGQGPASNSYMIFDLFGGSGSFINSVPPGSTAFVHRDSLYSIQMFTYWDDRPEDATAYINWIEAMEHRATVFVGRGLSELHRLGNAPQSVPRFEPGQAESCEEEVGPVQRLQLSQKHTSELSQVASTLRKWTGTLSSWVGLKQHTKQRLRLSSTVGVKECLLSAVRRLR